MEIKRYTSNNNNNKIDKKTQTQNENIYQGNKLTRMRSTAICRHKSTNTDMKTEYKYR